MLSVGGRQKYAVIFLGAAASAGTFHKLTNLQTRNGAARLPFVSKALKYKILQCIRAMPDINIGKASTKDSMLEVDAALARHPGGIIASVTVCEVIAARYEEQLKLHKKRDLQDDIRTAVHGMPTGSVAPLGVRYLLVDELQDSDLLQLERVLQHAKADISVTVCGDDDQSLYTFRHALGHPAVQAFIDRTNARAVVL